MLPVFPNRHSVIAKDENHLFYLSSACQVWIYLTVIVKLVHVSIRYFVNLQIIAFLYYEKNSTGLFGFIFVANSDANLCAHSLTPNTRVPLSNAMLFTSTALSIS